MRSVIPKIGHLFIFIIFFSITIQLFADIEIVSPDSNNLDNQEDALQALWMDTPGRNSVNLQIGTVLLGLLLFITIYATLIYTQEVKKYEH